MKPQITQIILALSSWLLALRKQQAPKDTASSTSALTLTSTYFLRVTSCNFVANFLVIFMVD